MKILKKVISFILSAAMLCTIANVSVSADAPMYFDGITTNVFDQDFGDITSTSQASDFAFTGKWVCTGEFVTIVDTSSNGSIKTKNNIDLTGAYGYEFSVKMIMTQNHNNMYLAYNEAAQNGYKVKISKKDSLISLYRAGNDTALKTAKISVGYGTPYVWTARLEGGKLTIKQGTTTVLEYPAADDQNPDTEAASLNGIFGIEKGSDKDFAVINMKLDKLGQGVTVNDWRYEKKFSAKDTVEGLKADGITFSRSYGKYSFTDNNGVDFRKNDDGKLSKVQFNYDRELKGDYTAKLHYASFGSNASLVKFNIQDANNFYAVRYDIKGGDTDGRSYAVYKYTGGEGAVVMNPAAEEGGAQTEARASFSQTSELTDVTHIIQVKDNGDETITLTATAYRDTSSTVLATVSATIAKEDLYVKEYNKLNVYMDAPSDFFKMYEFTVYSTPTIQTNTRDVNLLNKTFETGDTVESLADSFTFDTAPASITTPTETLGTYLNTSDAKNQGLYWGETAATATYEETLSGDYTIEATTRTYQNSTKFYINSTSGNKRYEVLANSSKGIVYIYDGPSSSSSNLKKQSTALSSNFKGYGCKTTINVMNNPKDGSITITATITSYRNNKSTSCTYTDTGSPYTSGKLQIFGDSNTKYHIVYDVKITKHETYVTGGEYQGKFYIDGTEAASYEKGEIYFETPVVDLGTYTVVAALYEDNEMTGLKTFTTRDMCEGKLRLFNTSGSTAKESYVKVYLLDSIETLNKTMSVWTLK